MKLLQGSYFDMKLQVLIHGVNVVEDVLNYPGDDAHHVWVMEDPLEDKESCAGLGLAFVRAVL